MQRVRRSVGSGDQLIRLGATGLIAAGVVVAVAIATDGTLSRGINGIGAMIWLASTALLVVGLREGSRWLSTLALALVVTVLLSFVVEPTNIATAVPGFAIGGAAVALISRRPVAWAFVVPALWLPVHLLTAVVPAIIRASTGGQASVRTDPPPTAAVVPLLMIVSAAVAGWLIGLLGDRRTERRNLPSRRVRTGGEAGARKT